MIVLLSGVAVVVAATIAVIVISRPRYSQPSRSYEICDGWLIEHADRHTFTVHCPDCDWHLVGSHHVDGHLTVEEAVDLALRAIRDTGLHQHQHQEDL